MGGSLRHAVTRLLFRASALFARIVRVFEAAAAGTLTRSDLRAGITREFEGFNDKPELSGLLSWEQELYDAVLRPGDSIVVVGSGTGRDVAALVARGYPVIGVEPSDTANAAAGRFLARRNACATLIGGFYETIDAPQADVVLFSHRTYGLVQGSSSRVGVLRKATASLKPGGRIIASYSAGRGLHPVLLRLVRAVEVLSRSDVRAEPGDDFYRVSSTPPYFGYEHSFAPGEFEREAHAAALRIAHQADSGCPVAVLVKRDG